MTEPEVPDLNEQQVEAILAEALRYEFFELDVDGQLPRDPKDQKAAAAELVRQAKLSHAVGNRSAGVTSILFIAEVDQRPLVPSTDKGESMPDTQVDLSSHSDEAIQKFEQTLLNYDQDNEEVQQNLAVVRAEMKRRGISMSEQAPTNGNSTAAQPTAEQQEPAVMSQDARKSLEDRLTFSMMRTHGIDPSEVSSLSDSQLEWVVTHPGGDVSEVAQPQPPEPKSPVDGETVETTRMVVDRDPEPELMDPDPVVQQEIDVIDYDREELEAQVTGPMLKSYGRGRKDVPEIGVNELRFMIENPDGRVTQEQLLAARVMDEVMDEGDSVDDTPTTQQPEIPDDLVPTIAAQRRAEKSVEEVQASLKETNEATSEAIGEAEKAVESSKAASPPQRMTKSQATALAPPENPAQEIVDQENFPIPPEIDERPPRLPYDLSKASDDELRSYHARFHACHSRANYVVGLWEGKKRDVAKLIKGREVEVANNLPVKDPDDSRKRITDAQREAMVAADSQVIGLKDEEHGIDRVLRQLKALADGYARDVSTCSRQWAMRKEESSGAGGLK